MAKKLSKSRQGYYVSFLQEEHTNGQTNEALSEFAIGNNPSFYLKKDGKIIYKIIDGQLQKL